MASAGPSYGQNAEKLETRCPHRAHKPVFGFSCVVSEIRSNSSLVKGEPPASPCRLRTTRAGPAKKKRDSSENGAAGLPAMLPARSATRSVSGGRTALQLPC